MWGGGGGVLTWQGAVSFSQEVQPPAHFPLAFNIRHASNSGQRGFVHDLQYGIGRAPVRPMQAVDAPLHNHSRGLNPRSHQCMEDDMRTIASCELAARWNMEGSPNITIHVVQVIAKLSIYGRIAGCT